MSVGLVALAVVVWLGRLDKTRRENQDDLRRSSLRVIRVWIVGRKKARSVYPVRDRMRCRQRWGESERKWGGRPRAAGGGWGGGGVDGSQTEGTVSFI